MIPKLRALACASLVLTAPVATLRAQGRVYYPGPGDQWTRRDPPAVGMHDRGVAAAVAFAVAHETRYPRNLHIQLAERVASEPYPDTLGPIKDRGGPAGIITRHGYIVAEWGDVNRVDMTFSVSKSFLSAVAGLAFDSGLIADVGDSVRRYVHDGGFDSEHNAPITWRHLLTQTSEWEGTLWDKPDVADRRAGRDRQLQAPGTFWEYNDVRVNRIALALLRVWNRALPDVLRAKIMDPIGASPTWEWHGYRNSFVELDGKQVQSVSGGGHWGGGVWSNSRDLARFGLLFLRRGMWSGKRILSERWVELMTAPTDIKPTYGFLWWLNTEQKLFPSADAGSFFARGSGGNLIWVDPKLDVVVVVRWIDERYIDDFIGLVTAAVLRD
jgi:CubicO group peptidase (beta-lactamase class C family)